MTRLLTARRTLAAAALAPLLASGLVACGDDDPGASASAADTTTQSVETADLSAGDQVDSATFVKMVTDGVESSTTAHLRMDVTAGASEGSMKVTAEGDVDYATSPPSMAMTMSLPAGGGDMDVRVVDGVVYLSMGPLTKGKFWKLDPSDPHGPLASLGMDHLMDQMDPARTLEAMKDGISKVTYVGDEDGLDHYELTIDMKKMMDSMGGQLPPAAAAQLPGSVTYDIWLDDQNRFTRMRMDDLPMAGGSSSLEMTVSNWDEDVDIEAPPADQVTEMPDLQSMMHSSPLA